MNRAALMLILLLFMGFTTTLEVNPQTPITTNTLHCLVDVTGTGTLQANITWYVDGIAHTDDDETLALTSGVQATTTQGVGSADTTKNEDWLCQATVFNETHTTAYNTTAVTIANSAPLVTSPTGPIIVYEGQTYGPVQAVQADPDLDPVTFASVVLNVTNDAETPLFTITSGGIISFTPTYDHVGNHTMGILATDGDLVGGKNIRFDIRAINEDPYFNPSLTDQETEQDTAFSYDIIGYDRENDAFNITMESPLPELQLTSTNATHYEISFTTGTVQHRHGGVHTINMTIYEVANASKNTTTSFVLNVTVFNEPPVFGDITSPVVSQGDSFNLTINATDADVDDNLIFSIQPTCSITNPWTITTLDNTSNATGNIYVGTLTNDHVACRNVSLIVTDYDTNGFSKSQTVHNITFNITNTNDVPTIHELSDYDNSPIQQNMSALVAPTGLPFRYRVNATDPDLLTYASDALSYTDNTTLFDINATTGWIEFTPGVGEIGNHTINITVQDAALATDSRVLNLEIVENNPPVLVDPGTVLCNQDDNCTVTLQANDLDPGDTLTYTATLTNSFVWSNQSVNASLTLDMLTLNTTVAYTNFTNNMVGWYTYFVTVEDVYGAQDNGTLIINVSNINDAPFFDNTQDGVSDTLVFPAPVVEGYEVLYLVNATDIDFININSSDVDENLTLTTNISGVNTSLFTPVKLTDTRWSIQFTPQNADIGNYSVNFTLTDLQGAIHWQVLNFTIYNQSLPPNITEVEPYYNQTLQTTIFNKTARQALGDETNITLQEGSSFTFNITFTDSDSLVQNMTVRYYIDSQLEQETAGDEDSAYTTTFGYFDEGTYTYVVEVEDDRYETDTFTWNVAVENVNRPPQHCTTLADRNVTADTLLTGYLLTFYDPDDHPDHVPASCSATRTNPSQLTYSASVSDSSILTVDIDGEDVTLSPEADGTVTVTYTATDASSASVSSNVVTYYVTAPEETPQPVPTPSSGGGGSSPIPIPIPVTDDPEPINIKIIGPQAVAVYRNQTVEVPLEIHNPTDDILQGIDLTASVEVENVTLRFSRTAFQQLAPNETQQVTLYVDNYRTQGSYEILAEALVRNPEVNDSVLIFINALEQESFGEAVNTRVSFAQDLLESNPECLELNEFIERAQAMIRSGNAAEADLILREVIQACRFLVSGAGAREEIPGGIDLSFFTGLRYANMVLVGLLAVLVTITGLLLAHYYSASRKDE